MNSKIHIIGGPGSGKSYLAKQIAALLGVVPHDLDDLFWDNTANAYGTRNTPEARDVILQEILRQPAWIIEGVYHQWVEASFSAAEVIVLLQPSVWLRDWRIMQRFTKRRLHLIKGKRETFADLFGLLKWNHQYDNDNLKRALAVLKPYQNKLMHCRSANDVLALIQKMSQPPAH